MVRGKVERMLIAVKPGQDRLPLTAEHATLLGTRLGARLTLLTCVADLGLPSALSAAEPAAVEAMRTSALDRERDALEKLAAPIREAGVGVECRVRVDTPVHEAILAEADASRADLVVVGIHEPRPVPHTRLNDIDWQLMRLCPQPLLIVTEPAVAAYDTILAAVDPLHGHAEPSGLDAAIVEVAVRFGDAFNARLCVANVYPNPDDYAIASSVEVEPGIFYGTENIESVHLQAVERLLGKARSRRADVLLQAGRPAAVLAELAVQQKADLLVLGSVKRGRLEAAMLGSTAEVVLADAPCNVLLVKSRAQR